MVAMRLSQRYPVLNWWLFIVLAFFVFTGTLAAQQPTNVTAEAIGQANLRAATDINSDKVGEIVAGDLYPVVGRSQFYPWVLLGDPATYQPFGWVYTDLVSLRGDVNQVPFSEMVVSDVLPTQTLLPPVTSTASAMDTPTPVFTVQMTPTVAYAVTGVVLGEINIRYGPGIEYPRIGIAQPGESFEITAWHTQFPWVQIRYPDAPNGYGWVATDLLTIQGDIFSLRSVSQTVFELPTLTPTPQIVQTSSLLNATDVPLSTSFQALGDQLWNKVLSAGFEPETSKTGGLFLMDLQTGEAITFGNETAFSGISVNKVAILVDLYRYLDAPPDAQLAASIANTMICSENSATNRLLSVIGGGDEYLGADKVTDFLKELGLNHTFLTAPYVVDPNNIPTPPRPIRYPTTGIDQVRANPDPSNQLTIDEMGWLLASVYQCAYQDDGALVETFPGKYSPRECRQILHVMSSNTVDALLKTGAPSDTRVAHKHGWIADTHGNAAVFFTPGGDYVLVMMLYQPEWLDFQVSLPLMSEVSRQVYNYYNPDTPAAAIREGYIPEMAGCDFTGDPLVGDLMASTFDQ